MWGVGGQIRPIINVRDLLGVGVGCLGRMRVSHSVLVFVEQKLIRVRVCARPADGGVRAGRGRVDQRLPELHPDPGSPHQVSPPVHERLLQVMFRS